MDPFVWFTFIMLLLPLITQGARCIYDGRGSLIRYVGYDDVPQLMVSEISCNVMSDQLVIELPKMYLANVSAYADVSIDYFCFDSALLLPNASSNSCRDCIGVSSDEQAQSSHIPCSDCIKNHTLSNTWLASVDGGNLIKLNPYTIIINGINTATDVKCYLQSCGRVSPARHSFKFSYFNIRCPDLSLHASATTMMTVSSNTILSLSSSYFSEIISTSSSTLSTTTLANDSTTTFITSSIVYPSSTLPISSSPNFTRKSSTSMSQPSDSNTNNKSLETTNYVYSSSFNQQSNTSSITSTSVTLTLAPDPSSLGPTLALQSVLVIVAISLVFLVATIVLIGFVLIYKNWTNKLDSNGNKTVEDKHSEEVHKVGFEPSKLDVASLSSVQTIVQELYQPSLTAIINNKDCFGFKEGMRQMNQLKPNPTANSSINPGSPGKPLIVIQTLSSSPYVHRKINNERELSFTKLEIDSESHIHEDAFNTHTPCTVPDIHSIKNSQESLNSTMRDDDHDGYCLTSLNGLQRSLSTDDYLYISTECS